MTGKIDCGGSEVLDFGEDHISYWVLMGILWGLPGIEMYNRNVGDKRIIEVRYRDKEEYTKIIDHLEGRVFEEAIRYADAHPEYKNLLNEKKDLPIHRLPHIPEEILFMAFGGIDERYK